MRRPPGIERFERTRIAGAAGVSHHLGGVSGLDRLLRAGRRHVRLQRLDFVEERVLDLMFCVGGPQRLTRDRRQRAHEPTGMYLWASLLGQEAECAEHATPGLGANEQRMTRCQEMIDLEAAVDPSCQRATWHPRSGVSD